MRVGMLGALLWMLVLGGPAAAQQESLAGEPAEYRRLIAQALEEYGARNFAEARAAFLRAHALYPNARTLRGLGLSEFELKNYADCIARLEQALASQVRPLEGELRTQAEAALARARSYVGRYQLELTPKAPGTRVAVDGVSVEPDANMGLTLAVGEHTLLVQVPGYADEQRALSVKGGEAQRISIALRPSATTPARAPVLATSAQPAKQSDSLWSSPWLWTGVGAVVVGGVVTAVVLAGRQSDEPREPIAGDIGGVVQALGAK